MDLDTVKARLDGVLGCLGVVLHESVDVLLGHLLRDSLALGLGDGAGALDLEAALVLQHVGAGDTAQGPELEPDEAALLVDGVGDFPPCLDLVLGVDAGHVGIAAGLGRDEGGLGDEQSTGNRSPLLVVLLYHGQKRHVFVRGTEPGQGRHGKAVPEGVGAHLEGLEEAGAGHGIVTG